MDAKSIKGRFVGYPKDSLGYFFYLPAEQVVVVSRDAIFLEKEFLKENGITSKLTPPGTPQLNGMSERRNCTLLDMVRSMMSYIDLPISLWGYALQIASYIFNRILSKSISTTPYEIWYVRALSLKHVKIWGCPSFIKKLKSDKLDAKLIKGRFVGYPKDSLGYCFYLHAEQVIVVSRDVIFLEK